ncbi:MAG TPA: MFS transporter [Opitutus sp.]|nr:MFS transporter [Opitutus sp.]
MFDLAGLASLLRDFRVRRLLLANATSSIGSGVTLIAVPWMLVHRANGDQLYGWITLGTTIALFLIMPHYGAWLDRHSRKTLLLLSELFGFAATISMAGWAFATGHVATWQLVFTYFCGMLYYTLHYPAKYAFLQQIFARSQYQSLMGLLEIQGQTAMMIAGALGSVLVDRVPLGVILLIDALTYLFSFVVQSTIPYESTHLNPAAGTVPPKVWHSIAEGWRWLHERPRLTIFFACTLVPFITVMVSNYLFPIYVTEILHASSTVFSRGEIAFAVGAMLAGALVPNFATTRGADHAIIAVSSLCLVSLLVLMLLPAPLMFYLGLLFYGFGNAGTRVARNALLFTTVPNAVMGRVGMAFNAYDRILRTLLTFAMTLIVARGSAILAFTVLFVVLLAAFAGALASRPTVSPGPAGAARAG